MRRIKCYLEAVLASWRVFWRKVVHLITFAVNPLYRASYELLELENIYDNHKMDMFHRENGNDMYYTSPRYKADAKVENALESSIFKLRAKVRKIKKEGY